VKLGANLELSSNFIIQENIFETEKIWDKNISYIFISRQVNFKLFCFLYLQDIFLENIFFVLRSRDKKYWDYCSFMCWSDSILISDTTYKSVIDDK